MSNESTMMTSGVESAKIVKVSIAAGMHYPAAKAEIFRNEVLRLCEQKGEGITPEELREAAIDPESPLHGEFIWDEKKAAFEHQIDTARRILRSVKITIESRGQQSEVRAFHPVKIEGQQQRVYKPTEAILAAPDLTDQLLTRAEGELRSWANRYRALEKAAKLAGVFKAINTAFPDLQQAPKG
jgi:hypothetical protein